MNNSIRSFCPRPLSQYPLRCTFFPKSPFSWIPCCDLTGTPLTTLHMMESSLRSWLSQDTAATSALHSLRLYKQRLGDPRVQTMEQQPPPLPTRHNSPFPGGSRVGGLSAGAPVQQGPRSPQHAASLSPLRGQLSSSIVRSPDASPGGDPSSATGVEALLREVT